MNLLCSTGVIELRRCRDKLELDSVKKLELDRAFFRC